MIMGTFSRRGRLAAYSIFAFLGGAGVISAEGEEKPEISLEEKILREKGIRPTAEGIKNLLNIETVADLPRLKELFEKLGSEEFLEREEAQKQLEGLTEVPQELLNDALRSKDPEIRKRALRIQQLLGEADLSDPIVLFACLRFIARNEVPGLAQEILEAVSQFDKPSLKRAAVAALLATATGEKDRELIEAALLNPNDSVKNLANQWLESEKKGRKDLELPAWRELFDDHLLIGSVEGGNRSEWLKGIPRGFLGCFASEKKSANTMGSVTSRSRTSPWLYPEEGLGEIPKVLSEKGKRYYPIWGTWRQNYSLGNIVLDENGTLLDCTHTVADRNIHSSSEVLFLIVSE